MDDPKTEQRGASTDDHPGEAKYPSTEDTNERDPEQQSFLVWWDGDNDAKNPYNWPTWQKMVNTVLISVLTFVTPLASSIFAPGIPELMVEFKSSNTELAAFVVSVYVLGFAFGPLFLAPLSEMYGRLIVYHICNVCFIGCTIGCALAPTLNALIGLRFVAGLFGSCPLTIGGGSIADMITQEKRASAMAGFSIGPLIGPIIGPVVGGVIQSKLGWRWVFWVLTIVSGVVTVAMAAFGRETFAPVLLQRKTLAIRKETGDERWRSKLDSGLPHKELLKRSLLRPLKMLLFSPICTIFALYLVMVYGYLYLLFTSISYVFQQQYGFGTTTVGLVYLGLGVGSFIGLAAYTVDSNKTVKAQAGSQGVAKPEVRLRLLPLGAFIMPCGFFIYGWTAQYKTHWIAPIIGLGVIGVGKNAAVALLEIILTEYTGNLICFMAISIYLVDAYTTYAASALAANTVMRSIAGATLPLCGLKMYDQLGLGWGNSLLAFIAIAMLPIPILILRFGEKLRLKTKMDAL
jgi:multidrug resistance protein